MLIGVLHELFSKINSNKIVYLIVVVYFTMDYCMQIYSPQRSHQQGVICYINLIHQQIIFSILCSGKGEQRVANRL